MAAVAIASFAGLVFGPLADQRAFALAGVRDAGSSGYATGVVDVAGVARKSGPDIDAPARTARRTPPGEEPVALGPGPMRH